MSCYVENGELYHHGILGMKWGVHRYYTADGRLTPKGKARMQKIRENPNMKARQRELAVKAINTGIKRAVKYENSKEGQRVKNLESNYRATAKDFDFLASKTYKGHHNQDRDDIDREAWAKSKAKKYKDKATALEQKRVAREWIIKHGDKKIKDIQSGKIEAGKDFMVQEDYNIRPIIPLPNGVFVVTGIPPVKRELTYIEAKDKNRKKRK